jgi:hypothetical protein
LPEMLRAFSHKQNSALHHVAPWPWPKVQHGLTVQGAAIAQKRNINTKLIVRRY